MFDKIINWLCPQRLYGIRLDKNIYLGCTEYSYVNDDEELLEVMYVHFFANRKDTTKNRQVRFPETYSRKKIHSAIEHTWYQKSVTAWLAGGSFYPIEYYVDVSLSEKANDELQNNVLKFPVRS